MQVLDTVRWPPDPWMLMPADTPGRASGLHAYAEASQVTAATLAAHPHTNFFVSGMRQHQRPAPAACTAMAVAPASKYKPVDLAGDEEEQGEGQGHECQTAVHTSWLMFVHS